ncbi:MAG TPA: GreA/GreB family elongation factor, partial [Rhizomicrobium sp.]|nr:GreA/GreB family elongation factor [Rhizomicrobium sp.]
NPVTAEGLALIEGHVARLEAALQSETTRLRADGASAGQAVLLRETIARDLRYWRVARERAVVAPKPEGAAVAFGSKVTFIRAGAKQQTLRIVGEDEADPKRGTLSWRSPLAQALMGGEAGDIVEMASPKSEIEILRVEN